MTSQGPGASSSVRVEAAINRLVERLAGHWVALVSLIWLTFVLGAALTPWLAAHGYELSAQVLYWLYRPLCPQRPDHSFFVAGHKMAFEQRETAMFLAAAGADPLYALLCQGRYRVPGRLVLLALIPMLIDVATQTVGLRESDGLWRTLTGAVAVVPFILWIYPALEVKR